MPGCLLIVITRSFTRINRTDAHHRRNKGRGVLAEPSSSLHTLPTSCIPCPLAGAGLAGSQGALVVGRAWCGPRVPRAATAALRLLRLRTTPAEALQQRVSAAPPAQWLRDRDLPQGAESPPRVYDTVDCDQVLVCVCGEGDTQAAALTKHSYLPKPCSHQNFEKNFFSVFLDQLLITALLSYHAASNNDDDLVHGGGV